MNATLYHEVTAAKPISVDSFTSLVWRRLRPGKPYVTRDLTVFNLVAASAEHPEYPLEGDCPFYVTTCEHPRGIYDPTVRSFTVRPEPNTDEAKLAAAVEEVRQTLSGTQPPERVA